MSVCLYTISIYIQYLYIKTEKHTSRPDTQLDYSIYNGWSTLEAKVTLEALVNKVYARVSPRKFLWSCQEA